MIPILFLVLSVYSYADSLERRSCIALKFAFWHQTSADQIITTTGVRTTAKSGGFVGALTYSYWLQEKLAFDLSIGILGAEATSSVSNFGVSQRTNAVVPILLGLRYYFPKSTLDSSVRPFVAAAVGPYIGYEAKNEVGGDILVSQGTHSETSIGFRIGGGINFVLSRAFMLTTSFGYHVMTDFANPIGGRRNYSGPDFSLGIGFVFGKGVP